MKNIIILGAGMVGRTMAVDLSKDHAVTSVDRDKQALEQLSSQNIQTQTADLSDKAAVQTIIADADLVVGAVPGFMGYQTLKWVIEAGKDIVDISFFPEDPFGLDELAKEKGVVAVMDAGVAPGMSNIIAGYHNERMDVQEFVCYVGGLPTERKWPYEYKAPFSPIDVIEEYLRPSRLVLNGELHEKEALSEPEILEFPGVGELEAFNTDGLRTLIKTMNIPNMKEKTLRYPGHIELMRVLRETGFFNYTEMQVGESRIRPIDLTTQLLFPKWKLGEAEEEFTVMQILVRGTENGRSVSYQYDLLDRYDAATGASSMSRTTGYTCTAISRLVLDGDYRQTGVSPPEFVGKSETCFNKLLALLEQRGVHYKSEITVS
ncbi:MAG: saccharopine dehydrogenase NADP-binding domain-containing protein [Candidatus Marinimicrobia bacterium]|nr:saccharopine dehydrogenase NADP-binding domain-containing protein [Candidatus Neomarinimicrobiota bacterium]MCF7903573.1 saccharopine dehydrogenase NADP-binding domain-containing protein [Candidatus Neomarinimicrobiota bacterium]